MKKKYYSETYLVIMILISLAGICFASYKIVFRSDSLKENTNIQEEQKEDIIIDEHNNVVSSYMSAFKKFKEQNSDTVAYIKVNNTNIDYVVVQSNDNKYYLTHNFNKKGNAAGWIFADYKNKLDGKDKNIVLYGHSMKDKSMFGSLHNVTHSDWYKNKENYKIMFITEKGIYTYHVFSVYNIKVEDYYIQTKFKNDNEFDTFIKTMKKRSLYDFGVSVSKNDKVLTLSTCNSGGNARTVLHAKLIEE